MLEQFHYDSDLIGGSLMVRESRLIADLLLREATPEQWHQAIQIDNILQKRTPASAQRNATAIRKRLERLEPDFWKALRDGDDELATQVAFCGALERNLLLLEFMETVMRDAYISQAQYLDSYIWSDFWMNAHNVIRISVIGKSPARKNGAGGVSHAGRSRLLKKYP